MASFELDTSIYTRDAIVETANVFGDYCVAEVHGSGSKLQLSLVPKASDDPRVIGEFLNYALNLSIEHLLGA